MALTGKKILLGITGSIAAYKSATLVRLLIKAGAEVQVLMTTAATEFISPLTISTLSKNPVHSEIQSALSWNNHVELGLWADVMLIAPLTATTLAKMAMGLCDNILTASYFICQMSRFCCASYGFRYVETSFNSKEYCKNKILRQSNYSSWTW